MNTNPNHLKQVNVWEIMDFLKVHWRWYFFGSLLGLVVGALYYFFVPAKYEASVVLQPARVGSLLKGSIGKIQSDEPEPASLMVERFRQPSFFNQGLREGCQVKNEPGYQDEMVSTISASVVKSLHASPASLTMVKVAWKASTPTAAESCLDLIIKNVTESQNSITRPAINALELQKNSTQTLVALYTNELAAIARKAQELRPSPDGFNQAIVAANTAQNLRLSISDLRVLLAEQTAQLLPPYTQPLTKLEPISVSNKPVVTLRHALLAGLLIGLLAGLCTILIMRSIRIYKADMQ